MDTSQIDAQIEYVTSRIDAGAHLIPGHMVDAVKRYIIEGIPPGSFLTCLLSNDFMGAMARADDDNANAMRGWSQFLYNYAPAGSHGSPDAFAATLASGGLRGFLTMAEAA